MLPLKLTCFLLLCGAISALDHDHHPPHHPQAKQQKYLQEEKTVDISPEFADPLESFNFVPLSKIDKSFEITEDSSEKEVADDAARFGYKVDEEKTSDVPNDNFNNESENESNLKPSQDDDDMFLDSFFPTLLFLLSQPIFDEMIPQPQQQIEGPFGDTMCTEEPEIMSQVSSEPKIILDLNIDIKLPSLPTSPARKPINKFRRIIKQQKQQLQKQKLKQQRKRLRKLQQKMQMQMQNRQNKMNPFKLPMRRVPPKFRNVNQRPGRKFNNKRRQQNQQPTTILFFDPIDSGSSNNQNKFNEPSIFDFIQFPPQKQQQNKASDIPIIFDIVESPKTGGNQGSSSLFDIFFLPQSPPPQQQNPKQDDIIFFDFGGGAPQQQKPKQDDIIFFDFGGGAAPKQQQKQPSLMDLLFMPPQQQQHQQQPKQDDIIFIDFGPAPKSDKPKQSEPLDFFFYPSPPQQQKQQPKQDDIIFFDLGGSPKSSGKQDVTSIFDLLFFPQPEVEQQQKQSKDIPIYFEIITLDEAPQRNEKPQFKSEPTLFDFLMPQQQQQHVQEPEPKPKEESHKFPFFDFIF